MIFYIYLLLLLKMICAQRPMIKGSRYDPIPYYNLSPRPGSGVGLLQDLSNARILSNEPFIISFEFPKASEKGSSDSRKIRFGAKRPKLQRKRGKERSLRQFRHVIFPEGNPLIAKERLQILNQSSKIKEQKPNNLFPRDRNRYGKKLFHDDGSSKFLFRNDFDRQLKNRYIENMDNTPVILQNISKVFNPVQLESTDLTKEARIVNEDKQQKETNADYRQRWEEIKNKLNTFFDTEKGITDNEVSDGEDGILVKANKKWANCQLMRLLKAPQRNPYLYKLLPPNYPALIVEEEKQLQCDKIFDINYFNDFEKEKKLSEKIREIEKFLNSYSDSKVVESERNLKMRKKRDVSGADSERLAEEENTLQDESLQGKLEGEVRSDRSKRTKIQPKEFHDRHRRAKEFQYGEENKTKSKIRRLERTPRPSAETRKVADNRIRKFSKKEVRITPNSEKLNKTERGHMHEEALKRIRIKGEKSKKEIDVKKKRPEENERKYRAEADELEKKSEKESTSPPQNNLLQDVFSQNEVTKVVKQKELEANIFDKVLTAMRKYEDYNPYDESFRPHKRESKNETFDGVVDSKKWLNESASMEDSSEVQEAVRKLEKIFRILGVGKKKCEDCDELSEELTDMGNLEKINFPLKKIKTSKSLNKCQCSEDCPMCQNCVKCFRECKRNALASKNSFSNKQLPFKSTEANDFQLSENGENVMDAGVNIKDSELFSDIERRTEENPFPGEQRNNIKSDRSYRVKLAPSRDVKVYTGTPENKLLVWTKGGRRTVPWGPLTSDLKLYRDRARQILRSAEDILKRIKDTEEKLHSPGYYNDESGSSTDDKKKLSHIADIIKKVVNEDDTGMLTNSQASEIENNNWENPNEKEYHITTKDKTNLEDSLQPEVMDKDDFQAATQETIFDEESQDRLGTSAKKGKDQKAEEEKEENNNGKMNYELPSEFKNHSDERLKFQVWRENDEKEISSDTENMDTDGGKSNAKENSEEVEKAGKVKDIDSDNWLSNPAKETESRSIEAEVESVEVKTYPKSGNSNSEGVINGNLKKELADDPEGKSNIEHSKESENDYTKENEDEDIPAKVEAVYSLSQRASTDPSTYENNKTDNFYLNKSTASQSENEGDDEAQEDLSEETRGLEKQRSNDSEQIEPDIDNLSGDASVEGRMEAPKTMINEREDFHNQSQENHYSVDSTEKIKSVFDDARKEEIFLPVDHDLAHESENLRKENDDEKDQLNVEDTELFAEPEAKQKEQYEHINNEALTDIEPLKDTYVDESVEDIGPDDREKDMHILQEKIKPIEELRMGPGAAQTKEEKDAMLRALLKSKHDSVDLSEEELLGKTTEEIEGNSSESYRQNDKLINMNDVYSPTINAESEEKDKVGVTDPENIVITSLVKHLEDGHMDENDYEAVKNLDASKIDRLVTELQKKDDKGGTTNCSTRLKLCQTACGCNNSINGTTPELDKYDILKGFLAWLKEVKLDKMTPITA